MKLSEEVEQAKENYIKHGETAPMFIFYAGEKRWIMPFEDEDFNGEYKSNFAKKAMMVNLALDCHAYTFISEIWYKNVSYKKGDKIDPIVEDKPDKREGLLLLRISRDHKEGAIIEIIKQGEKVEFKESKLTEETGAFEGTFSDLLPPRGIQEGIPEEAKKYLKDFIMTQGALYRG